MKKKSTADKTNQTETASLPECISEVEKESLQLLDVINKTQSEMAEYYPRLLDEHCSEAEVRGKADSLRRATTNIIKAMMQTYVVSDELNTRWNDIQRQRKKTKLISAAPANGVIDLKEKTAGHFAQGLNLYKLLLICFIGSFVGVVIELLWCLVKNGYLESRAGLVYGPFNLLYGAGAVALTVCLYHFRNRGNHISFLGGMVVGSAVEYLCSWGQEFIFGSRSWDYSNMPFNINGRICLLYSVFWGFLGVFWIKNLYPRMAKWILRIPNKTGKIVTWALVVFFLFNGFMSGASMLRWSQRTRGREPANAFWKFIDQRFPDERMEKIYANMQFMD